MQIKAIINLKFALWKEAILILKVLSPYKILNAIRLWFSFLQARFLKRIKIGALPYSMAIEPTTSCNLHCPECPSGLRVFSRQEGNMEWALFKKLIDENKRQLIYLTLYFQGEPLLNPLFFKMTEYATENKIFTTSSTNAHFINDNNARKIVKSGLKKLIFSMDGLDQKTYAQYRIGGNLNIVIKGIDNLIKAKSELKSNTPLIEIQFIVFKHNEHQINDFKRWAKGKNIDKISIKSAQVYDFKNGNKLIPDNKKYARYKKVDNEYQLKKKPHQFCRRMWRSPVITQDGLLVPCCYDKDATHNYGNISTTTFKQVWHSETANDFRKKVFTQRSTIDICRNCTE